ncbi:hypothetical protein ABE504_00045 [Paenibacillus oryzisoli]|uniref:OmpL47-type beta-barrel domain-containing protein n=1 Tax=Paenibacillus oryzisoli TaxID=1850517 RepID=UPI003D27CE62
MGKFYDPKRVFTVLLAFLLLIALLPVGNVFGEGTLLKTGNYYYSVAPNDGKTTDKGATGLVSSANGALLDGSTSTYAGFMGSGTGTPGNVQVVFDLLKDYPLDSINVVLNSLNANWGFQELTVKYRPEDSENYYIAIRHTRTPGIISTSPSSTWNYAVNVPMSNKTARFIIIDIKRPHPYQHIPLTEVQIYKGIGNEGVNPGPALTAEQMALELTKDTLAAENLLKTGNYYYSVAPNDGGSPDKGATGLVSAKSGVLMDGSNSTYAGFMGSGTGTPGNVRVVFDLLKDYPLDSINLVLNSPNANWGFQELTVKYRPEASDDYYIAARHTRTPGIVSTSPSSDWNYAVNVPMPNKTARFIIIDIKRPHAYQHIPLTEVQIFKGAGQPSVNPGPALTAEQMALELTKDTLAAENLLKTGNYYYSVAPNDGGSPDKGATGLVSAKSGVLMDGSNSTYAGFTGNGTGTPGNVQVVFDLLKDYPIDSINVVLNSPNANWGFKEFTVKYRPEALTEYYYLADKHIRTPGITSTSPSSTWNYSVNIPMANKTARFIIIDIKRPHAYQHIPLTEVQIFKGTGEVGINFGPALTAEQMRLEFSKDALLIDKYGQFYYENWPGKITSDEQLQQEYTDEANALSNVSLDTAKYDQFGGLKDGGQYKSTGYFRLQKIDNKWWFVTPDGYKFILKGVDATSLWEWGYGTSLKKADGSPRNVFEELPDPVAYSSAYVNDSNGERVSFVIANAMRKYGSNFEKKWEDITKKRLIDWGFNAFSKWTQPRNVTFPNIQVLQDPGNLKRIQWTYDVFDPQNESIIENALSGQLQSAKNSPWLIGYTYDNEAGWNTDIVKEVLTYSATSPAKSAFVDFLAPRYNNDIAAVNQLLGTSAASFAELKGISINIAKVPALDISDYIKLASRTYFSTITNIIKKYDTNHLFLGVSVVPTWRTSLEWDSAGMEFVDAFSIDEYASDVNWISRYEAFGKPLLNLEYTFSTTEHGLSPVNAATTVASTADRGYAFKSFVEGQLSHPLFVGSGWFSYYDQAVTGRKDGENYNIGLVNQQDQPYSDMVNVMKTVNPGLEQVHNTSDTALGPETTAVLTPSQPDGQNGGYASPVTLGFDTSSSTPGGWRTEYSSDGGVTWQVYAAPVTYDQVGTYTVSYHSIDEDGNEEAIKTISFKLSDDAAPKITVTEPAEGSVYRTADDLLPQIAITDDMSGVDHTKTIVSLDGKPVQMESSIPLYELNPGPHSLRIAASDLKGNEGSKSVTFTTSASIDSLSALVARFRSMGWIDNDGIAGSLTEKLNHANLDAFIHEVQAQSGKHIDAKAAGYLLRDSAVIRDSADSGQTMHHWAVMTIEGSNHLVENGSAKTVRISVTEATYSAELKVKYDSGLFEVNMNDVAISPTVSQSVYTLANAEVGGGMSVLTIGLKLNGTVVPPVNGLLDLVRIPFTAKGEDGIGYIELLQDSILYKEDLTGVPLNQDLRLPIVAVNTDIGGKGNNRGALEEVLDDMVQIRGKRAGDDGYNAKMDINKDSKVNIVDLAYIFRKLRSLQE